MTCLALSLFAHLQHGLSHQLAVFAGPGACRHGDKGVIAPAGRNRIELVLPSLEALLHLLLQILPCHLLDLLLCQSQIPVLLDQLLVRLLCIRLQDLVHAGHRKAAVLLARRAQDDISDHIEGRIQCLRLVVPEIPHLKAPAQDILHIEQAAVHGISPGGHVMDIDVAVPDGLDLLHRQEELFI